ncbi:MAG: methyltransferase domain-containing protein [Thermoleophilia bacterium]|nr:methyltransferase domain-containing protein [Thermoleophilia bacterium]
MLLDYEATLDGHEIVERDDGFVTAARLDYFAPVRRWNAVERRALRSVRGRVLDAGCGAGRVALALQERGHEVVGIDVSPGAVEVARRRGVRDVRLLGFERVDASLGRFGTVVLFGNNFGLFGGEASAVRLLRRLAGLAERIVASTVDPYATDDPAHLAYHERNRRRGRMPGQLRIRVRHRDLATPWFDYLLASREEIERLAAAAHWRVHRFVEADGPLYVVVLEPASGSAG